MTELVVSDLTVEYGSGGYVVRPLNHLSFTAHDVSNFNSPPAGFPDAWWVDQASYYNASGHLLSSGFRYSTPAASAVQHYQPGDRFWQFQTIESAILAALAAVLIGFAIYWVTRRVT